MKVLMTVPETLGAKQVKINKREVKLKTEKGVVTIPFSDLLYIHKDRNSRYWVVYNKEIELNLGEGTITKHPTHFTNATDKGIYFVPRKTK